MPKNQKEQEKKKKKKTLKFPVDQKLIDDMAIHIMRLLPTQKQGLEDVYVRQSDLIDSYLTQVPVVCSVSLVRG